MASTDNDCSSSVDKVVDVVIVFLLSGVSSRVVEDDEVKKEGNEVGHLTPLTIIGSTKL